MGLVFDYAGLDVYTSDGEKLGKVKSLIDDQYVSIDRSMARDIVVPFNVLERTGDHLVVPYTEDFIDDAPSVDLDGDTLSVQDRTALDSYYVRRAA